MIKEQYDNQPAFPIDELNQQTGFVAVQHMGITIRDYFAARAMQSYLLDKDRDSFTFEQWATAAYEMADAMLEARASQ